MSSDRRLTWLLKIACAGCFIGHGVFGVMTKVDWLPFYFSLHIPPSPAYSTMPLVGTFDILMGILILAWPCPAILIWMTTWAVFTALLRPFAKQSEWEFFERAGNFGVPLAFLLLSGWFEERKSLFERIKDVSSSAAFRSYARRVLVLTVSLLLIGHGALMALVKKDLFAYQFLEMGLPVSKEYLVLVGVAEIGMGMAAFFWRPPAFLIFIFLWKIVTELFYPLSGFPVWEFVERFGSYFAPLALLLLRSESGSDKQSGP